jgi:hypothetical protein
MKPSLIKTLPLFLLTGTAAISAPVAWTRRTIVVETGISHHLVERATMERKCITTDLRRPRRRPHCFSTIMANPCRYLAQSYDKANITSSQRAQNGATSCRD